MEPSQKVIEGTHSFFHCPVGTCIHIHRSQAHRDTNADRYTSTCSLTHTEAQTSAWEQQNYVRVRNEIRVMGIGLGLAWRTGGDLGCGLGSVPMSQFLFRVMIRVIVLSIRVGVRFGVGFRVIGMSCSFSIASQATRRPMYNQWLFWSIISRWSLMVLLEQSKLVFLQRSILVSGSICPH
jgi:hypothetical protein